MVPETPPLRNRVGLGLRTNHLCLSLRSSHHNSAHSCPDLLPFVVRRGAPGGAEWRCVEFELGRGRGGALRASGSGKVNACAGRGLGVLIRELPLSVILLEHAFSPIWERYFHIDEHHARLCDKSQSFPNSRYSVGRYLSLQNLSDLVKREQCRG
jgi:hypothetical protein